MRKLLIGLVAATAVIAPASAASATNDEDPKMSVAICHNIPHNPHVIIVNDDALGAHEAHLGVTDEILGVGLRKDLKAEFGDTGTSCAKNGQDGEDGEDGTDGKDGKDGEDGKSGNDGAVGPAGPVGPMGPQGPAGTPADAARIEQLERIVTELNNRLFILEHAAPGEAPVAPVAPATGELPKTGSTVVPLLFIGGMLALLGIALRRAVRLNRG